MLLFIAVGIALVGGALLLRSGQSTDIAPTTTVGRATGELVISDLGPQPIRSPGVYPGPRGLELRVHQISDGIFECKLLYDANNWSKWHQKGEWLAMWNDHGDLWFADLDGYVQVCINRDDGGHTTRTCGELGGWQGVPEEFVALLPERLQKMRAEADALQAAREAAPREAEELQNRAH